MSMAVWATKKTNSMRHNSCCRSSTPTHAATMELSTNTPSTVRYASVKLLWISPHHRCQAKSTPSRHVDATTTHVVRPARAHRGEVDEDQPDALQDPRDPQLRGGRGGVLSAVAEATSRAKGQAEQHHDAAEPAADAPHRPLAGDECLLQLRAYRCGRGGAFHGAHAVAGEARHRRPEDIRLCRDFSPVRLPHAFGGSVGRQWRRDTRLAEWLRGPPSPEPIWL
ncbi:unnamed protein product, partial [Prorocentrum cordatum]